MALSEFEMDDDYGQPIYHCKWDTSTGEILDLSTWHGCDVNYRAERRAREKIDEIMAKIPPQTRGAFWRVLWLAVLVFLALWIMGSVGH